MASGEWPKVERLAALAEKDLRSGFYGVPGERFLSVREFAKVKEVSYVSAQKTLALLRERGALILYGKFHYIAGGTMRGGSSLSYSMRTRQGKRRLIGIHLNKISNPFFITLVENIQARLAKEDYRIIIASSQEGYAQECDILRSFLDHGAAGVVSFPGYAQGLADVYRDYPLPFVFAGRQLAQMENDAVLVDNPAAGRHVASHLADMGYRNFAYIGIRQLEHGSEPRLSGFQNGLYERGFDPEATNILYINMNDPARMTTMLIRFLIRSPKPLAVFCFHDLIAVELVRICRRRGIRIPEDIGIVGFDDLPISLHVDPPISTVAYRFDKMAQYIIELLLRKIRYPGETAGTDCNHYVTPILITRKSSARLSGNEPPQDQSSILR